MQLEHLEFSVRIAIIFSGIFLWLGMLTGIWKYYQISQNPNAKSHYYVDIAHRSSLLYAPASLILAVLAYFSHWSEVVNASCILANLIFFSFSIMSYVIHGILQDTTNQFKQPHRLGSLNIPKNLMRIAMILLIFCELGGTMILLCGACRGLF